PPTGLARRRRPPLPRPAHPRGVRRGDRRRDRVAAAPHRHCHGRARTVRGFVVHRDLGGMRHRARDGRLRDLLVDLRARGHHGRDHGRRARRHDPRLHPRPRGLPAHRPHPTPPCPGGDEDRSARGGGAPGRREGGTLVRAVLIASLATTTTLSSAFIPRFLTLGFGVGESIWHGWFMAVSTFNNAGFVILPGGLGGHAGDAWMSLPILIG